MLIALALVVGTFLLNREPGVSSAQKAADEPAEVPGYAARNAQMVETGDDGRPLYTLNADQVRQHPNDNRVQLDSPRMTYIATDGNAWHVKAKSGQIREDGANVELFGDVHLSGLLPGAEAPLVFDTSILSFDTKNEVATTTAPVTLDWNGQKMNAVGLLAKLNDQHLTLESRVHGSFHSK
jgi:LPS export ABC transporter protein LptC